MKKADIRAEMMRRRRELHPEERTAWSASIANTFFANAPLASVRMLHVFLSIQRMNEVDSWPIIRTLWAEYPHITTVTSITEKEALRHVIITPDTILKDNKWGIPTPQGATAVEVQHIDMVLVPLLAIDRRGHRVGYGKGYYDGFLSTCRNDIQKMGISFFPVLDEEIEDTHSADIPLDGVITPQHYLLFNH